MQGTVNLKAISDDELLRRLSELLRESRRVEADLVAHIAEVDERRLFAREAMPSMFAYCTEVLHLSEAWRRIRVARASRRHPMLLPLLRDGRLHLSGIVVLAPHLTADNRLMLLRRAIHKTKRQIEELVAEVAPREDAPAVMRKLPARRGPAVLAPVGPLTPDAAGERNAQPRPKTVGGADLQLRPDAVVGWAPAGRPGFLASVLSPDTVVPRPRPPRIDPLAPARYKVEFTADAELHDMLERLQALMRSSAAGGDLAAVLKVAVAEKLERLEAKRFGKTKAPRKRPGRAEMGPRSRHIPAAVRRFVEKRDGGRCTYRDRDGRRCPRRHDLEFHHRAPYGCGGEHSPENLTLMCRAHNLLLAEHDYGKKKMARYRRPQPAAGCVSETKAVWLSDSRPVRFSGGLSPPAGG